jgi:hypothetical protein
MSWAAREFYAEKHGKYYSFESKKQRDDAINNYGMEAVPSHDVYKYRIKYTKISLDAYDKVISKL